MHGGRLCDKSTFWSPNFALNLIFKKVILYKKKKRKEITHMGIQLQLHQAGIGHIRKEKGKAELGPKFKKLQSRSASKLSLTDRNNRGQEEASTGLELAEYSLTKGHRQIPSKQVAGMTWLCKCRSLLYQATQGLPRGIINTLAVLVWVEIMFELNTTDFVSGRFGCEE